MSHFLCDVTGPLTFASALLALVPLASINTVVLDGYRFAPLQLSFSLPTLTLFPGLCTLSGLSAVVYLTGLPFPVHYTFFLMASVSINLPTLAPFTATILGNISSVAAMMSLSCPFPAWSAPLGLAWLTLAPGQLTLTFGRNSGTLFFYL